ncbi:pseudouridine synthase [Methylobrevis albus]|nr:pseudouridine synthase [Methylobrevis albus]
MRLVKLLGNLGYGSRKEMQALIRAGRITDAAGTPLEVDSKTDHADIRFDDAPLDPAQGSVILFHKPVGFTCSTKDPGRILYELLPSRFRARKPIISPVGRLDRDTSGLLLLTDDGAFLHRVIAPKSHVGKVYEAELARPLEGHEAGVFASGTLLLQSETTPLAPAEMVPLGPRSARLVLYEGRYHQVRRMFAAVGNHVEALHRPAIGRLTLGDLAPGTWRVLPPDDIALLFEPPAAP